MNSRLVLLGLEVAWQPLYPWDAWIQWATKARVWYELGQIVPFARVEAWLAANGAAYFDGGRAEKIFQGQLDQVLSEELSKASASKISDPMFKLFQLRRQ